ncbi:MAG TPA: glycosyltransferase family 2 protein [Polyangia bacterium]|nr:glycosyltransferase family 2 protein [Polyangia bacterium]
MTESGGALPGTLSVVIPTYQRPEWIRRAVRSLATQTRPPDEVIAVARDTDTPTHESIAALQSEGLPFRLLQELVSDPGFIPPVKAGVAAATGDVVAIMDDDAEAEADWAGRLLENYGNPRAGAVGGRIINMTGETRTPVGKARRMGEVTMFGRFIGNMYREPDFDDPAQVDFLMGGNMSFRREVAQRLEFDLELNRNVAQGYEVDLGLQVKRMGWQVIFDPRLGVRHYSAPRQTVGMRPTADLEAVQWYAYNHARVALRRLRPWHGALAFSYLLAVGERRAPGVVPMLLGPVARRAGFDVPAARAALRGRLLAARGVFRAAGASSRS